MPIALCLPWLCSPVALSPRHLSICLQNVFASMWVGSPPVKDSEEGWGKDVVPKSHVHAPRSVNLAVSVGGGVMKLRKFRRHQMFPASTPEAG